MDVGDAIRKTFQEMIVTELELIRQEYREIKTAQELTNKRLDDMNAHLVDQSRRIDKTSAKVDAIHMNLIGRIDEANKRIDETNKRIDKLNADLVGEIMNLNRRVDEVTLGLGRLYEVIVRREEHEELKEKVEKISRHFGL